MLHVDQLGTSLAIATLHHPEYHRPMWNTTGLAAFTSGPILTYSLSKYVLDTETGIYPAMIFNPSLESIYLHQNADGWTPELPAVYKLTGLKPDQPNRLPQPVTGKLISCHMMRGGNLALRVDDMTYPHPGDFGGPDPVPFLQAVGTLGGTVLAVTHIANPEQLTTAEAINAVLCHPSTLTGWAALARSTKL